jgi:hypothetical protein
MFLLDPIVQILIVPVLYPFVQLRPDRARVTIVPARRARAGLMPVTSLAERTNVFASSSSRVSLNLTSTSAPERSMARYR